MIIVYVGRPNDSAYRLQRAQVLKYSGAKSPIVADCCADKLREWDTWAELRPANGRFKTCVVDQNDSANRLDRAVVFHFLGGFVVHARSLLFESTDVSTAISRSPLCSCIHCSTVLPETAPPRYRSISGSIHNSACLLADDSGLKRSALAKGCVRPAVGGGESEQCDNSQHPK